MCRKKNFDRLKLPLHVVDEFLEKCSFVGTPLNYGKKVYQVNIIMNFNKSIFPMHYFYALRNQN
jgi:hypothetical protein